MMKSKTSFFTTEAEKRDIKALAVLSGLSLSNFIRHKILDISIKQIEEERSKESPAK